VRRSPKGLSGHGNIIFTERFFKSKKGNRKREELVKAKGENKGIN
jgi:hypothetical protein